MIFVALDGISMMVSASDEQLIRYSVTGATDGSCDDGGDHDIEIDVVVVLTTVWFSTGCGGAV